MRSDLGGARSQASSLVDVLDRVLDKGLVVAGDIRISLAEVELLTIRIRLIVCSLDKAREIGLDWWEYDRHLSPGRQRDSLEAEELRAQVRMLEHKLARLESSRTATTVDAPRRSHASPALREKRRGRAQPRSNPRRKPSATKE